MAPNGSRSSGRSSAALLEEAWSRWAQAGREGRTGRKAEGNLPLLRILLLIFQRLLVTVLAREQATQGRRKEMGNKSWLEWLHVSLAWEL